MRICDKCRSRDKIDNIVIQTDPNQAPINYVNKDLCLTCRTALVKLIRDFVRENPTNENQGI